MLTVDDTLQAHWPKLRLLARRLAARHDPAWDTDDLAQEGALGFLRASQDYDPARGATLWTYAEFRVVGAIRDARRELDPMPRSLRTQARTLAQAVQTLEQQHGVAPAPAAVAEELGVSLETYEQWRSAVACLEKTSSLDYHYGAGMDDVTLYAFLLDPTPDPAAQAEQADAQQQRAATLACAMALLPVREAQVLRLRYWEEWTFKAIGAQLGLSESRVSQLHTAALAQLRRWLTSAEAHGTAAYLRQWRAQRKEAPLCQP